MSITHNPRLLHLIDQDRLREAATPSALFSTQIFSVLADRAGSLRRRLFARADLSSGDC